MADRVDRLELDADELGDPGALAVADHAVALHHVVAVGQPVPGAHEGVGCRVVVGIEDADELATHARRGRVDVLRLGCRPGDGQQHEPPVAFGDLPQCVLDRQRVRGVVREDDLELVRVIQAQERLDGVDDRRRLIRQIRGDDSARHRVRLAGFHRARCRVECEQALKDDEQRRQDESRDHHPVRHRGGVPACVVGLLVQHERQPDAEHHG